MGEIKISADDDCFMRAEKMFEFINLRDNRRLSHIMAEIIAGYMKLDEQKLKSIEE